MSLKSNIVVVVILYLISTFTKTSISAPVTGDNDLVKVTLLDEYWSSDHRVKRAADSNLPDHLFVSVPVKGQDLAFRMKRSQLLPIVTSDRNRRISDEILEDTAVYTDLSMSSAMIVKRHVKQYALKGTFVHDGTEWSIQHADRQKREADEIRDDDDDDILHWIEAFSYKNVSVSYIGDAILPPEESESGRENKSESHSNGTRQPQLPGQQSGKDNHRQKRSFTRYVIKVAFVVDYADYLKWISIYDYTQALPQMRLWYTYVAEDLRIRYENIEDQEASFTTVVTALKVLTVAQDAWFMSNITDIYGQFNRDDGLKAFARWYPLQNDIPPSDHYMLFTGNDMPGITGVAYVGALCTANGISICENNFNGLLGKTVAHELGHSLSSPHDTETFGINNCTKQEGYIMAPRTVLPIYPEIEGRLWKFTNCSVRYFKNYLRGKNCAVEQNVESVLRDPGPGKRAGEVLSKDAQCRMAYRDSSSYFCSNLQPLTNNICTELYCRVADNACTATVAQEYTECGINKWCLGGICVNKPEESTSSTTTTTHSTTPLTTTPPPTTPSTTIPPTTIPPTTTPPPTTPPTTTPPPTTLPTTTPSTTTPSTTTPSTTTPPTTTTPQTTTTPTTTPLTTTPSTTTPSTTPPTTTPQTTTPQTTTPPPTTPPTTTPSTTTPPPTTTTPSSTPPLPTTITSTTPPPPTTTPTETTSSSPPSPTTTTQTETTSSSSPTTTSTPTTRPTETSTVTLTTPFQPSASTASAKTTIHDSTTTRPRNDVDIGCWGYVFRRQMVKFSECMRNKAGGTPLN